MSLQCLACGNIVLGVAQAQDCKSCGNGVMCCKAVNHLGQTCQEHALRHILSEAARFAKTHLPSGTFHSNGLIMGEPGSAALSRFLAAQSDIPPVSAGQFGWHGTKSVSAVLSICREGWDPTLRRNKSGEFFAKEPQTSMRYAGPTNMMVVAFIRSGSWLFDNGYLIVDNPLNRSVAYVLPVGVVTYNGAAAPPLRPPCVEG